jgi:3-hydroxyacyl-[acyl-carrier-protein] dehydratase
MPPPPILDPERLDPRRVLFPREAIYAVLPQQFEFSQLDAIVYVDKAAGIAAGIRAVRPDEWWCRGHMPDYPLLPGVLMVESAAQLAAFMQHLIMPMESSFMGFGGIDGAKFRGSVIPPADVLLIGKMVEARARRFVCDVQSYSGGQMVFEGRITGMPLRK